MPLSGHLCPPLQSGSSRRTSLRCDLPRCRTSPPTPHLPLCPPPPWSAKARRAATAVRGAPRTRTARTRKRSGPRGWQSCRSRWVAVRGERFGARPLAKGPRLVPSTGALQRRSFWLTEGPQGFSGLLRKTASFIKAPPVAKGSRKRQGQKCEHREIEATAPPTGPPGALVVVHKNSRACSVTGSRKGTALLFHTSVTAVRARNLALETRPRAQSVPGLPKNQSVVLGLSSHPLPPPTQGAVWTPDLLPCLSSCSHRTVPDH